MGLKNWLKNNKKWILLVIYIIIITYIALFVDFVIFVIIAGIVITCSIIVYIRFEYQTRKKEKDLEDFLNKVYKNE